MSKVVYDEANQQMTMFCLNVQDFQSVENRDPASRWSY
jgi:hypothetical protein